MAQTVSNLTDILKEAWTDDRLNKQFYDDNPLLSRIEKLEGTMIGEKAIVPIHNDRNGGYTSLGPAGGNLNTAGQQEVDSAEYTLVQHWQQVSIQAAALNQTQSSAASVVVAKDLEIQGAVADMRRQCTRQAVTNGDGILAACDTGGASATIELLVDSATAYGYQSIVRGWLHAGLPIDIGTPTDIDNILDGEAIVSVSESATDPDIVITSSKSTVATTDFVFVHNPNDVVPNTETNGLRNIVNSSGALGGLNPSTSAENWWKAASRDTTTTVLSLNLMLNLSRAVRQKTGVQASHVVTSLKQEQAFYELLQNQVRFASDGNIGAGSTGIKWGGMEIVAVPDVLDQDLYVLTMSDLALVTGAWKTPKWASDIEGAGGRLRWAQGTTSFVDAVTYVYQLGCKRRNSHAAATGLTA